MVHSDGHHWGVALLTASGVLNEPVMIQYSGNRKMTAAMMTMRTMVMIW